jgi:hypothetical protein
MLSTTGFEPKKRKNPASLSENRVFLTGRAIGRFQNFSDGSVIEFDANQAVFRGFRSLTPEAGDAAASSRFFDKLGERLAFERQGVRLYECIVGKVKALGKTASGPSPADLEHILLEEREHFLFLQQAIAQAGGDPTMQTPSADITGVLSMGLVQVVSDPRTTVAQCLQAMLQAELADNDGWDLLQRLAASQGESDLEEKIQAAKENEADHLEKVRGWLSGMVLGGTAKPVKGKRRHDGREAGRKG